MKKHQSKNNNKAVKSPVTSPIKSSVNSAVNTLESTAKKPAKSAVIKAVTEQINWQKFAWLMVIISIAAVIVYGNHFNNDFHFDDGHTIQNNVYVKSLSNIPRFFRDGSTFSSLPTNQSYRPVVSTTLAIDYWLGGGLVPFYFHLSTFILFLAQGALMMLFYLKLTNNSYPHKWNLSIAAFATSWYMFHPASAETVNYIIQRGDVISTLAVVLAFVMFLYWPTARKFHLYLIPIGIGTLAKPPAVMFAPLLFLYLMFFEEKMAIPDLWNQQKLDMNIKKIQSLILASLPAFLFCGAIFIFTQAMEPKSWSPGGSSRFQYLITQPFVVLHYVGTFFLPVSLSADTDWGTFNSLLDPRVWIGCGFVAFLLYLATITSRRMMLRPISFGILWFLIALIPTSSIIPLAEVMNDHRLFFPYIGLMISVCWAVAQLLLKYRLDVAQSQNRVVLASVLILILCGYAYGTRQRNEVWKTEESLWLDTTIKSPKNGRGLMNYGRLLMARGDYAKADQYFTEALKYTPYYSYLHLNIGILKEAIGQPAEAEKYFKNAIYHGSIFPDCYFFYGRFLKNQNRIPEAIIMLNKSLEMATAHLSARDLLLEIYYNQSNFAKVKQIAEDTLKVAPDHIQSRNYLEMIRTGKSKLDLMAETTKKENTAEAYLNLSLAYYQAERFQECIDAANQALTLKPDYPEAYNNICSAYNGLKMWDKAIEAGTKAVALNPNFLLARNNLEWAKSQKK